MRIPIPLPRPHTGIASPAVNITHQNSAFFFFTKDERHPESMAYFGVHSGCHTPRVWTNV